MSDHPWLPFYGDVPPTITYPDATLFELLERSATEHPDACAVDFLGERIAYRRLHARVIQAARALRALGVKQGDRLALLLPNDPHAIILLYAANRVGAVVSPWHAESGGAAVAQRLERLAPEWMAVSDEHLAGVNRLLRGSSVNGVIVCRLADFGRRRAHRRLARLRDRWDLGHGGVRGAAASGTNGDEQAHEAPPVFSWRSFLGLTGGDPLPDHRELHDPSHPALVLFTGGTTGPSRAVVHADRQLTAVALQMQVQGPVLPGQSICGLVSLAHGYGLTVAVHAALSAAATTVLVPYGTPRSIARLIRRKRPDYLVSVPAVYGELVRERLFRRARHRSLMGAFCGGDRLARSVSESFERIVRRRGGAVSIREGYGLTETAAACATMPDGVRRPGSVGIPYPDTVIGIASPAVSASEPPEWRVPGELGEILVSGPTVMSGYLHDDEANARAFATDEAGHVWLRTGDLGRMDEDGFLYFVERMDRAVDDPVGTIHPGLTELALYEQADVLEGCVTAAVRDERVRLTAHVAPFDRDRDHEWLERHLRESLRALPESQQPERYAMHVELPRTPAGVIDLAGLRADRGRS